MEEHPFILEDIIDNIKDLYEPQCQEKGLSLHIDRGMHAQTPIMGDALRLKQVLFNLVSNAIKFTHKGAISFEIQSAVEENDKLSCRFAVRDTGIGLSESQIERLFSAFSQADNSVTRKYGGTGLGLIISKNIIAMMHGKIWVESRIGEGSVFYCTAIFSLDKNFSLRQNLVDDVEAQDYELAQPLSTAHLLLVEDNEINQLVGKEILLSANFTLDIANNGQEALDMLENNRYDAILMDIQMPVMDGYTATKKIRAQEEYASLPIIAMSAHAMKGDKELSLASGMNDHITKPIEPDTLFKALHFWITQSRSASSE